MEDDSDLVYEKEIKVLLEHHRQISKCMMTFAILVMTIQTAFGIWCLVTIYNDVDAMQEGLLIIWFHFLKIFHNVYLSYNFFGTMKAKQISSPMVALATYLTLLMYYGFLFVHVTKLHDNMDKNQLYYIAIYPITDWIMFFLSYCLQRNIMKRRDDLFKQDTISVSLEKKQDDLFDVRYLPVEYVSDEQDDDSD